MTLQLAALLAALLLFGLAAFYGALALGAPWADFAWGTTDKGALPPRLQLGSALLTPLILAMAVILLVRGGWLYPGSAQTMAWPAWAVFLFSVTTMFSSFRSPSPRERRVTARILAVIAVLTGIVALGLGAA